jgi:hypothetical protein
MMMRVHKSTMRQQASSFRTRATCHVAVNADLSLDLTLRFKTKASTLVETKFRIASGSIMRNWLAASERIDTDKHGLSIVQTLRIQLSSHNAIWHSFHVLSTLFFAGNVNLWRMFS